MVKCLLGAKSVRQIKTDFLAVIYGSEGGIGEQTESHCLGRRSSSVTVLPS